MTKYNNDFYFNLKQCLTEMYEFTNVDSIKKLLDIYDKLDLSKIMNKYLETMDNYDRELKSKNEIMFEKPIAFFPGIDMNVIWSLLNSEQKEIIWNYLQLLYSAGKVILQTTPLYDNDAILENLLSEFDFTKNKSAVSKNNEITNHNSINNEVHNIINKISKLEDLDLSQKKKKSKKNKTNDDIDNDFDPYAGVGNPSSNFGINDILNNMNCQKEEENNGLLGMMTNMMANNTNSDEMLSSVMKMLNIDDALKNMENVSDDKIEEGSDMVKNVINAQLGNSETGSFINEIVGDITDEFKHNMKNNKINSIEQIMNISNEVAKKILPKMENRDIKIEDLLKSSLEMFSKSTEQFKNSQKHAKNSKSRRLKK